MDIYIYTHTHTKELFHQYVRTNLFGERLRDTNKDIGRMLVESVETYGFEVWTLENYYKKHQKTLETDYLRRSIRIRIKLFQK